MNFSDLRAFSPRGMLLRRSVAVLIAALSLYSFVALGMGLFRLFTENFKWWDIFFLFVFPIPFLIFCIFSILVAYNLWHELTPKIIRQISFIAALVFISLILSILPEEASANRLFNSAIPDNFWNFLSPVQ